MSTRQEADVLKVLSHSVGKKMAVMNEGKAGEWIRETKGRARETVQQDIKGRCKIKKGEKKDRGMKGSDGTEVTLLLSYYYYY